MYSAKNDNSELGYFLRCLSFQIFGRILGYHDENCMKKATYHWESVLPKNSEISEFSENSELSPWPFKKVAKEQTKFKQIKRQLKAA